MDETKAIIEGLIFASETPLTIDKIVEIFQERNLNRQDIAAHLSELMSEYSVRQGGFYLQEVAGGYQFRTRPELSAWIAKLKGIRSAALTTAALETLAIIAYRQPVVKAEVERLRGVDVSRPLRTLLERKLVRMVGRKDVPGKPMIYGTTRKFLEVFSLKDLSELPTMGELKDLTK
ncbi:MAG TPA: SMC-Scp complex subunit ScpB [Syntrophus sp. (in: bacteria)]|jgi:segregation and condensation protein B|nr:SMC-Scp complex subunit ScpB [Syntrophus sp. (in: bacteria)]